MLARAALFIILLAFLKGNRRLAKNYNKNNDRNNALAGDDNENDVPSHSYINRIYIY